MGFSYSAGGAALAGALEIICACMNVAVNKLSDEKVQIAHEILRYLIDNPKAQDTLEGIVTWWLLERTIKQQTRSVKEVLALLVKDCLVIAHEGRDSRTHYKVNPRQRKRIVLLLQKES